MNKDFEPKGLDQRHFISSILGREYPPTLSGYERMKQDEAADRRSRITDRPNGLPKIGKTSDFLKKVKNIR